MQARYYDPVIGRFYSNDPVGYTLENPVMSFNRYLYVNNNPYKYIDPTGMYLTAREEDREQVLEHINSQGSSEYTFNESGFLEKVAGGKGSGSSDSFSNAIDEIITSDDMGVSVFISEVASTGENVDSVYSGGATDTLTSGSSDVFISGNSATLNGVGGSKISVSSAEILVHELVDHALPNFNAKGGPGTGYSNVNKVRKENGQHLIGSNPHVD